MIEREVRLRMTYDPEADAGYIYFQSDKKKVNQTYECELSLSTPGEINLDLDKDGKIVGIEILDVSSLLDVNRIERNA